MASPQAGAAAPIQFNYRMEIVDKGIAIGAIGRAPAHGRMRSAKRRWPVADELAKRRNASESRLVGELAETIEREALRSARRLGATPGQLRAAMELLWLPMVESMRAGDTP